MKSIKIAKVKGLPKIGAKPKMTSSSKQAVAIKLGKVGKASPFKGPSYK